MMLFKHILLSLLLLTNIGYSQNSFIKVSTFNRFDLVLDGVDEHINIDNTFSNVLSGNTKGTLSIWVKQPDYTTAGIDALFGFGDTDSDDLLLVFITSTGLLRAQILIGGVLKWDLDTDTSPFTDGQWHLISLTTDAIEPILYVDNAKPNQAFLVSTDKTIWLNGTNIDNGRIGSYSYNGSGEAGEISAEFDEASLWNTDLSLTEIQEIYNNKKPTNLKGHSKVANLVGWYQMGEFSSYTSGVWNIVDGSTYSNTALSVNMEEADRIATTLTYEQPLGLIKVGNSLIATPFLPSDLSDLFWWIRAGIGVTESGGDVSQVDDFGSANLPMLQATGLDQPTLVNNVVNGHPVIRFDGVDHFMTAGVAADWKFMNDGSGYTVYIVFQITDANPDVIFTLLSTTNVSSVNTGVYIIYDDKSSTSNNDALRHQIHRGAGGTHVIQNLTPDDAFPSQTFGIMEITYERGIVGDDSKLYVGGILKGSSDESQAPNNVNPLAALQIGRFSDDTFLFKGDFAETIIYKRALPDNERLQVRNYLQTKFSTP